MARPRIHHLLVPPPLHPEILPKRRRAKTIRRMGEMPELHAGEIQRVEQTEPNLRSADPFSFGRIELIKPVETVRRVNEAELDELLDWGLERFQQRYPRCSRESVLPMLRAATRGGKMYFCRTDDVCGLFFAEVSPWEPMLFVYEVFVVSRVVAAWQVKKIYQAGRDWAKSIGACGYRFGVSTGIKGVDFEPLAKSIGYTHTEAAFTLRFDVEAAPVERLLDGGEIAARLTVSA